ESRAGHVCGEVSGVLSGFRRDTYIHGVARAGSFNRPSGGGAGTRSGSGIVSGFTSIVGRWAWIQSVPGAIATWSVISMRFFLTILDSHRSPGRYRSLY